MGIGNELLGDDGAGMAVAHRLRGAEQWIVLLCGTAPENFTAPVRREHPKLLVLVDAADMGLPAGSVRRVPPEHLGEISWGTHQLPLSHLLSFLAGCFDTAMVIGIQPGRISDGIGLSLPVERAVEEVCLILREHRTGDIREFDPGE